MDNIKLKLSMKSSDGHAHYVENNSSHRFFEGKRNEKPSAKKSPSGIYYHECQRCRRCVFEDGTGSATQTTSCY